MLPCSNHLSIVERQAMIDGYKRTTPFQRHGIKKYKDVTNRINEKLNMPCNNKLVGTVGLALFGTGLSLTSNDSFGEAGYKLLASMGMSIFTYALCTYFNTGDLDKERKEYEVDLVASGITLQFLGYIKKANLTEMLLMHEERRLFLGQNRPLEAGEALSPERRLVEIKEEESLEGLGERKDFPHPPLPNALSDGGEA